MPTRTIYSVGRSTAFFKPAPLSGAGAGRVIFVNKNSATSTIENRFVAGSGVGGVNSSARRALMRRASSGNACFCMNK
jgi:hypothetical protein